MVKKFCDPDGSKTPLLNIFAIARIIPVCNMSAQPTCDCGCIVIIPSVIMAGRALKTFHTINIFHMRLNTSNISDAISDLAL